MWHPNFVVYQLPYEFEKPVIDLTSWDMPVQGNTRFLLYISSVM